MGAAHRGLSRGGEACQRRLRVRRCLPLVRLLCPVVSRLLAASPLCRDALEICPAGGLNSRCCFIWHPRSTSLSHTHTQRRAQRDSTGLQQTRLPARRPTPIEAMAAAAAAAGRHPNWQVEMRQTDVFRVAAHRGAAVGTPSRCTTSEAGSGDGEAGDGQQQAGEEQLLCCGRRLHAHREEGEMSAESAGAGDGNTHASYASFSTHSSHCSSPLWLCIMQTPQTR